MAKYRILTQAQQDDVVVNTLMAQEASHHSHALNVDRYAALLQTLPQGPRYDQIAALLVTEQEALDFHEHLIEATTAQLPAQADLDASVARLAAKSNA